MLAIVWIDPLSTIVGLFNYLNLNFIRLDCMLLNDVLKELLQYIKYIGMEK